MHRYRNNSLYPIIYISFDYLQNRIVFNKYICISVQITSTDIRGCNKTNLW